MADSDFDLTGRVRIDTTELDGLSGRIGSSFKGMAAMAAGALAAAGVGTLLKGAVDEAREAEKIGRLTENVIRSTGGAAKVTADQVGDMAERLSNYAGVDDDVVQGGANMLLTFKGVRNELGKGNDIFDQANKAALDLSATFGTDVNSAAMLVGKALDNPAAGLAKLTKMGVTFTDQQKEQVQALVASGKTMDAQKIILAELASQTGGAAAAAADPWQRFEVVVGNLKERLGGALLPTINTVATVLADKLPGIIARVVGLFRNLADTVGPYIAGTISTVQSLFKGDLAGASFDIAMMLGLSEENQERVFYALEAVKNGIGSVIDFVSANGPRLIAFLQDQVLPIVARIADFVGNNLKPILAVLGTVILGLTSPIALVVAALALAYQRFEGFRNVVDAVASFVLQAFQKLVAFGREILPQLQEAVGHVFVAIEFVVRTVVDNIMKFWAIFGDDILRVGRGAFDAVKAVVETAINTIANTIRFVLAVINGDWGKAWQALKDIASGTLKGLVGLVDGALSALIGVVGGLYDGLKRAAKAAFSGITDAVADIAAGMFNVGADIVGGIINGIKSMAGKLIDAIKRTVTDPLPAYVRGAFESRSPSRLFARIGETVPQGLALGIDRGASDVLRSTANMLAIPSVAGGAYGYAGAGAASASNITIDINFNGVANPDDMRGVIPELTNALRAAVGGR